MNSISRAAKKIIKYTKGKINFNSVESWLNSAGYKVIFYNSEKGDIEITRYSLNKKAAERKGFTYCGTAKIVFIDNTLQSQDKFYVLCHEAAHIALGHLELKRISVENDIFLEMQANTVAHMLVTYKKQNKAVFASIVLVVFLILSRIVFSLSNETPISSLEEQLPIVYITPSGQKYHRESCIHIRGRNCTDLSVSQAKKNYEPCLVCIGK